MASEPATQTGTQTSLRAAFLRDGFVMLPGALTPKQLTPVQSRLGQLIAMRHERYLGGRQKDYHALRHLPLPSAERRSLMDSLLIALYAQSPKHVSFLYDTAARLPETYRLLAEESVLNPIRTCLDVTDEAPSAHNALAMNNVNLRIDMPGTDWRENLPWHQDYPYYNPLYVPDASIASWIALFDCPLEVGPMALKKGSHHWGELPAIPLSPGETRNDFFTIPESHYENPADGEVQPPLKTGDLLLFDLRLVHRSGINQTKDTIRWSAQARYHDVSSRNFLSKYHPETAKSETPKEESPQP